MSKKGIYERAFAGTTGPDKCVELAWLELEMDVLHGRHVFFRPVLLGVGKGHVTKLDSSSRSPDVDGVRRVLDVRLLFQELEDLLGSYPRPLKRLLYEYSNKGTMTLRVSPKKNYLIIENIVPPRQQDYGHPETYLPDGSYEYMLWQKGQWHKKGPLRDFDLE